MIVRKQAKVLYLHSTVIKNLLTNLWQLYRNRASLTQNFRGMAAHLSASVSDPHLFQYGSGSSILDKFGSGSGSGSRGFIIKNWKNLQLEKKIYFWSKIPIHLSPGLHKGLQGTVEAISPQKRTSREHQNLKFLFLWLIFALLGPDPNPADQNQCGSMRIRIRNTRPWINVTRPYTIFFLTQRKNIFELTHIWKLWTFRTSLPKISTMPLLTLYYRT